MVVQSDRSPGRLNDGVRWPRRLAVLGALALFGLAGTWRVITAGPPGPADQFAKMLTRARDPARFSFEHRAGGTRVLDCFLPNRRVIGSVDADGGVLMVVGANGALRARRTGQRVFLHRSLFREAAVRTPWLELRLPVTVAQRSALVRALGLDLAGYVLAYGLPANGWRTARAALDAAARVERLSSQNLGGGAMVGYRITVGRDPFNAAPSSTPTPSMPGQKQSGPVDPPMIDVWLDGRGDVRRITVRPTRRDGTTAAPEEGWTVDYRIPGPPIPAERVGPSTHIAEVNLASLAPPADLAGCALRL